MATTHPNIRQQNLRQQQARQPIVRAAIALAGGVASAVGAAIVMVPRSFIDVNGNPTADLLSETRAPGAALLAIGVFVMVAAARRRRLHEAAFVSTLLMTAAPSWRSASHRLSLSSRPSRRPQPAENREQAAKPANTGTTS